MRIRSKWFIGLGIVAASATVSAAPPSAEMLSFACAGCHGTGGVSAGPSMPSLAGQNKVAFVEAMKAFRSGDRPSSVMGRLAKGYSDEEIELMAGYFAKQKHVPATKQKLDPKLVKSGKDLYNKHCKRCHLEGGKEFEEDQPIVAGQWLTYLQIQMDEFHAGNRKMSEKKAEKMKPMKREELEAIAHYYASVK
jgi:sulfide dehydrogenase cytochrome subunit